MGWIVWVAAALPVVVFTVFVVLANWPSGSENAGPSLAGHDGEIVAASKETTCILKTQCGGPPPSWWQQAWDWLNDFGLPYLAMTIAGASLAALLLGLAWWSWRKSRGLTAASSAPAPAGSSPTRPA